MDISDAFMSLAVHEAELPHALAPEVNGPNFYLFVALLFGFKTAPLLWSRIAALISRLLQSLVQGKEAQHQTYLDDGLWILQGTLVERNSVLSMILTTLFALGLKVSLKKGLRSVSSSMGRGPFHSDGGLHHLEPPGQAVGGTHPNPPVLGQSRHGPNQRTTPGRRPSFVGVRNFATDTMGRSCALPSPT